MPRAPRCQRRAREDHAPAARRAARKPGRLAALTTTSPEKPTPRRILVAGATGVIGRALVPLLLEAGHAVAGMTRTPGKADALRALGAEPVVCDVYDRERVAAALLAFGPEVVVDELTDLPDEIDRIAQFGDANARIRTEGTRNLLDAAAAAGASRLLAQSVAWDLGSDRARRAVAEHERMVLDAGGVVLRYGMFHGPSTYHDGAEPPDDGPRVHVATAARRTAELLDAQSGIYEILDG